MRNKVMYRNIFAQQQRFYGIVALPVKISECEILLQLPPSPLWILQMSKRNRSDWKNKLNITYELLFVFD